MSYSVSPGQITFLGAASTEITVRNVGGEVAPLKVSTADYHLTSDGRTNIGSPPPNRSARRWLVVTPSRLRLQPGESAKVQVSSAPSRIATPGDHNALVLVATDPGEGEPGKVTINTQIGVRVFIRVPGEIRRDLLVQRLVPLPAKAKGPKNLRIMRLRITNRGNIDEKLPRGRVRVELRQGSRKVATLSAKARTILPDTRGHLDFSFRGKARGVFTAIVTLAPVPAAQAGPGIQSTPKPTIRRYRIRL